MICIDFTTRLLQEREYFISAVGSVFQNAQADSVCVNPYHYERVVSPGIDLSGLSIQVLYIPI